MKENDPPNEPDPEPPEGKDKPESSPSSLEGETLFEFRAEDIADSTLSEGKPDERTPGPAPAPPTRVEEPDRKTDGDAPPPSGRTLGPYRILGEIGRGGMGVVHKAFHPQLKRTVALKVLIAGEDASEEAIERFHREAEAVAKLGHHPNIVPVYDIGRDGRNHYFAMHFVEGHSLDRLIDESSITPRRAAMITRKLAEALCHAHDHGILHRDIKPANVLMAFAQMEGEPPGEPRSENPNLNDTGSGRSGRAGGASGESGSEPMLTDFGLAKDVHAESSVTRSGMTLGTPQYMPPEQADGRLSEIDERSDIYSLGAVLFEMLVRRPPFEGESAGNVIRKVILEDPPSPRRLLAAVPRDLDTICLKCLEKEPERRYPSATALKEDLERFLAGDSILARPVSFMETLARKAKRNKALTAAIATALTLLVAGLVAGVVLQRKWSTATAEGEREKEARERAEEGEKAAKEMLERGRKASKVFLGAVLRLGSIHARLKKNLFDSRKTRAQKREMFDATRARIEEFISGTGPSPENRATALAVKGWLLRTGTYTEEGLATLTEAQTLSPEVPWGFLFEGAIWLSEYLAVQPLPEITTLEGGIEIGALPPESGPQKAARERFEKTVGRLSKAQLWRETWLERMRV
ncbi:MAG: serine/threonine-protein kinase [Planctomycetota bacterium]